MFGTVFKLPLIVLNISIYCTTKVILLVMSKSVYQLFVLTEVFLNSYNVVYPSYLAGHVAKVKFVMGFITIKCVKNVAVKTIMLNGFMRWLLRFLISLLSIFVAPITYFVSIRRTRKCPPPTDPLLFKSAATLTRMIRNKEVSSETVVKTFIDRCKQVNPYLNAIVEPRYEIALREARNVDKMLASTEKTPDELAKEFPLLGVPLTVKESIAVEGMSNDCGCVKPDRKPATKDADIVKLAKAAGAIPIAVTNTPQYCMNWETYNNVTGLTMNPYDQKRTTGGSSGGEVALISAGASVIGLGSDIAGSLRLPPMFTGVFGHKPSPRVWSVQGHVPDCLDPDFEEYFALGPITRYAEDLPILLNALKQPGGLKVTLDNPVDISKLKVYYMEGDGSNVSNKIGSDVKAAMLKAREYLKKTHGIEVEPLKIQNMEHMWEISIRVLMNIRHVRNIYTHPEKRDQWVSVWPQLLKKMVGFSDHAFSCVAYGPLQKFFDALPKSYYEKLLTVFDEIKTDFSKVLTENTVLLYPTYPNTAHVHYRVFYKFLNCSYLTVFNALGFPATACPLGMTDKGLPVGIQIVANKGYDHLTFALAKEFEKGFGGWVPPNKDLVIA